MRAFRLLPLGLILVLAGCADVLGERSVNGMINKKVKTPDVSAASVESAARVDKTGRQLLAGSPFLGVEVAFQTIGHAEPELFHRDAQGLFISEGLVEKCKSNDQLAAVLASEIAHMVAETRMTERMQLPEPLPTAALGPKLDGTTDYDPGRDMELAKFEKLARRPAEKKLSASTDTKTIARGMLKDAGFDPKLLDEVAPILREAGRNQNIAKQLGGRGDTPRWSN